MQRQPVNQVDIDRIEPQRTGGVHQTRHLVEWLHPVHGLLDGRVEVLHAKAQSVEAQRREAGQPIGRDRARIDLDRTLGPGREVETVAQHAHQAREFSVGQEGRRAATQVKLGQRLATAQHGKLQPELALQRIEIFGGPPVLAGDDLVAGAVIANRFAERNVNVNR